MGPFMLAFLVAWYLVYRFGGDTRSSVKRVAGRTAQAAAGATDKVTARRSKRGVAGWLGDRLRSAADRWLSQSTPNQPRTAAGQKEADRQDAVPANTWLGMVRRWLRVAWVDAVAAAESAQQRRMDDDRSGPWLRWPTGDDPQAPIRATAERLDEAGPNVDDVVHEIPGKDSGELDELDRAKEAFDNWDAYLELELQVREQQWRERRAAGTRNPTVVIVTCKCAKDPSEGSPCTACREREANASPDEDDVIDAEIVEELSSTPLLSATPVAALPSGTGDHMSDISDNTAAESGLGSYIAYAQKMADNCGDAVNSAEATLGSLDSNDWSGAPVDAIKSAMEHLSAAQEEFNTAYGAFQAALSVRESYAANTHAGTKESVMAD